MKVNAKLSIIKQDGKDHWILRSDQENINDCYVSWLRASEEPDEDRELVPARAAMELYISEDIGESVNLIVTTDIEGILFKNEPTKMSSF